MWKWFNNYQKSIKNKLNLITAIGLSTGVVIITIMVYLNVSNMNSQILSTIKNQLKGASEEYYDHYIESVSGQINQYMENVYSEMHILGAITQTYMLNREAFKPLSATMATLPFFQTEMKKSATWIQNEQPHETSLFATRFLLNADGTPRPATMEMINDTLFLDLIMPAFTKYGVSKVSVYFTGNSDIEIIRMSPYTDLGSIVYGKYPELADTSISDIFNPGLEAQWEKLIEKADGNMDFIAQLARVTPPVQDYVTGQLIITITQPIVNADLKHIDGYISYDVPISNIVTLVETVKLSQNGFSFLAQSNGNMFALNSQGIRILGFDKGQKEADQSLAFKPLERFLINSQYEDVKNMNLTSSVIPSFQNVTIEGTQYMLTTKSLAPLTMWSKEEGFTKNQWVMGFMVPRNEVYSLYDTIKGGISNSLRTTIMTLIFLSFMMVAIMMIFIRHFNTKIAKNLSALTAAAHKIKQKKFDIHVDISTVDELGILGESFNEMAETIRTNTETLERKNAQLTDEIKERQKRDHVINYLENFDALTNLPNKKAFMNILKEFKYDQVSSVTLITIGLDDFGKINEAYGWKYGDELIRKVAKIFEKNRVASDVFKFSGDEFGILCQNETVNEIISRINHIITDTHRTFFIYDTPIKVTSSIGISTYPWDCANIQDVFKQSLTAMQHSKELRKGHYKFYNEEMNNAAKNRLEMISALENAVKNAEFTLVFQPIVDTKTEKINGIEALLRWFSPVLGQVSPVLFIPIAEKSKSIIEIGNWVIVKAFEETYRVQQETGRAISIAINISVVQLMESDIVSFIETTIHRIGIDPKTVIIEITEGLFIQDITYVKSVLTGLQNLGLQISVDDFGTGYSSLTYIKDLPLSKIKIDRSFVLELEQQKGKEIVNAIIGLGKNLKLSLVAEGVENKSERDYLASQGCEEIQGYYYYKPMSCEALIEILRNE